MGFVLNGHQLGDFIFAEKPRHVHRAIHYIMHLCTVYNDVYEEKTRYIYMRSHGRSNSVLSDWNFVINVDCLFNPPHKTRYKHR